MSLAERLASNGGISPGYHLMRHVLSIAVLMMHGFFVIKGSDPAGIVPDGASAAFAKAGLYSGGGTGFFGYAQPVVMSLVASFFVLSGFLVSGSAFRNRDVGTFLFNRMTRIVPALASEVLLSALVLGPLVTSMPVRDYVSDPQFLRYLGNIFGFVTFTLPGVFATNPWPDLVNASLWTLPAEFYCYAILSALMMTGLLYRDRVVLVAIVVVVALLCAEESVHVFGWQARTDVNHFSAWFIVYEFMLGVAFRVLSRKVPYSATLFAASAVIYCLGVMVGWMDPITGLCLAYCTIYVGEMRFPAFDRAVRSDLSYGIYLYAFPISQTCMFLMKDALQGLGTAAKAAMLLPLFAGATIVFAYASWIAIERPALRLKSAIGRGGRAKAVAPAMQRS